MNNIIIIGFKNTGKSIIGRLISEKLGIKHIDLDDLIEEKYNTKQFDSIEQFEDKKKLTCREIHKKHGRDFFRSLESQALIELVENNKNNNNSNNNREDKKSKGTYVISVGGGTPENEKNRELLKNLGTIIFLDEEPNILFERIKKKGFPPFFDKENPRKSFNELFLKRTSIYEQIADIKIDSRGKDVDRVVDEIMKIINNKNKPGELGCYE